MRLAPSAPPPAAVFAVFAVFANFASPFAARFGGGGGFVKRSGGRFRRSMSASLDASSAPRTGRPDGSVSCVGWEA